MPSKIVVRAILIIFIINALVISPSIRTVVASGTIYIRADGSVDPPGSPISRNGNVYTLTSNINSDTDGIISERDNILIDGAGHYLQGANVLDSRGITLLGRNSIVIKRLRIAAFDYGIYLESCSDSQVYGNIIENNYYGIWLFSSVGNNITENNITACSGFGIGISFSSDNNELTSNTIANSGFGIGVDYSSNYNTIVHNAFINNTNQAYTQLPSTNSWDEGYPTGGNYWSDYNGTDYYAGSSQSIPGGDGIGDTSYTIDDNNIDHYPLMKPYGGPHDVGITNTTAARTFVGQGYNVTITLEVTNYGEQQESISIAVRANSTTIFTKAFDVVSRSSIFVSFAWNTSDLTAYDKYMINASVTPVLGETDLTDNTFIDGTITVVHVGDINGDRKVDITDVARVSGAFGSLRVSDPLDPRYGQYWHSIPCQTCPHTPNADINDDGKIDITDLARTSSNFGWHQ